jgi:hypothetical protein
MDNLADNTYLMKTHLKMEKAQRGDARCSSRVELGVSPRSRPRLSRRRPSPPDAATPASANGEEVVITMCAGLGGGKCAEPDPNSLDRVPRISAAHLPHGRGRTSLYCADFGGASGPPARTRRR